MSRKLKLGTAVALICVASAASAFLLSSLNVSKTHADWRGLVHQERYFIHHVELTRFRISTALEALPLFALGYGLAWLCGGIYLSRMRKRPLADMLYKDSFAFLLSFSLPFILASDCHTTGPPQQSLMRLVFLVFAIWMIGPIVLTATRCPTRRQHLHVLGASLCILLTLGVSDYSRTLWGDEPHYLIMADSILQDGDLNLRNNYESQSYRRYCPSDLTNGEHVIKLPGNGTSEIWSPQHFPAVAILVAPFHGLFGAWGAKIPMILLAALTVMFIYLLAVRLGMTERRAAAWSFAFALLLPTIAYSSHLYPEMPVAFLATAALWLCTKAKMSPRSIALCAITAAVFPWFGMRSLPFTLGVIFCVIANNPGAVRRWLLALVPSAISLALLALYYRALFGVVQPGIEHHYLNDYMMNISVPKSIKYLGAIFLDNESGIFVYVPILMLAVPGFIIGWRVARKFVIYTFLLLTPYVLLIVLGYSSWHGDWSPAGRFMACACPLFFIGVVFPLNHISESRLMAGIVALLLVSSWAFTAEFYMDATILYYSTIGIPRLAGEKHIPIDYIAPSFFTVTPSTYILTAAWVLGIAILTYITLRKANGKRKNHCTPRQSAVCQSSCPRIE